MNKIYPSKSRINPSRFIPDKYIIKDAVNIMHHIGLSSYKRGSNHKTMSHQILRYSIGIAELIISLKSILFLSLYFTLDKQEIKKNERIFITLCDYAYFIPEIRIHWNIISTVFITEMGLVHFLYMRNSEQNWTDLLDCLTGDIKPIDIGLNHVYDINKILNR